MNIFKCFLKVLNKNKMPIILYTIILIAFAAFQLQSSDNSLNFVAEKPDIYIINEDETKGITQHLIQYLEEHCNHKEIKNAEDALFYRDVNYIIVIPKGYRNDFLAGKNPMIEVKSTNDYQASYAEMLLNRYLKIAHTYKSVYTEEELIEHMDETLKKEVAVEMTSKLDNQALSRATFYYNFLNYSFLAGCVYVISLMLFQFRQEKIQKRTMISPIKNSTYQRILLLSNSLFAFALWIIYVLLSFVLLGDIMFSLHGLFYILNSFCFAFVSLTIAFFIANIVRSKNTINGIINVIALGSSFLCGAFVPMAWLPPFVLNIAHILPSYWYMKSNELINVMETIQISNLKPVFFHMIVLVLFGFLFIFLTYLLARMHKKRR